jgi:hypothetical protein
MDGPSIPDEENGADSGALQGKQGHNSGEGCRELARGSQAEADASVVPNLKLRLENSAATWTARAEMLERLDRKRNLRLESGEDSGSAPM